jgi:hypothetical protein
MTDKPHRQVTFIKSKKMAKEIDNQIKKDFPDKRRIDL